MKLYLVDINGNKRYLNITAATRAELSHKLGGHSLVVDNHRYSTRDVHAEVNSEAAPVSAVIGGALGLIGGMAGVIAGGALGALLGNESDKSEIRKAEIFNRS